MIYIQISNNSHYFNYCLCDNHYYNLCINFIYFLSNYLLCKQNHKLFNNYYLLNPFYIHWDNLISSFHYINILNYSILNRNFHICHHSPCRMYGNNKLVVNKLNLILTQIYLLLIQRVIAIKKKNHSVQLFSLEFIQLQQVLAHGWHGDGPTPWL